MTDTDQVIDTDRYLSIGEVAEELGVVYLTARSYIKNGYIQAIKRGGNRYRVSKKELDRFIKHGNWPAGANLPDDDEAQVIAADNISEEELDYQ